MSRRPRGRAGEVGGVTTAVTTELHRRRTRSARSLHSTVRGIAFGHYCCRGIADAGNLRTDDLTDGPGASTHR
jgi:hypothetical protein